MRVVSVERVGSMAALLMGLGIGLPATTDLGLRWQLLGIARNETERGSPSSQVFGNHALARATQVKAHVSFRVVPATAEHRLDDLEVILSGNDLDIGAPLADVPGEHRDVAQLLVEVEENAVLSRGCQEVVELATQVHGRPRVPFHVDIAELFPKPQQLFSLRSVQMGCCETCDRPLDRFPSDEDLDEVLNGHSSDRIPATPVQHDQAVRNQLSERLTYRRAADLVGCTYIALDQWSSGTEFLLDDSPSQIMVGVLFLVYHPSFVSV
jgi:hypothetical protein